MKALRHASLRWVATALGVWCGAAAGQGGNIQTAPFFYPEYVFIDSGAVVQPTSVALFSVEGLQAGGLVRVQLKIGGAPVEHLDGDINAAEPDSMEFFADSTAGVVSVVYRLPPETELGEHACSLFVRQGGRADTLVYGGSVKVRGVRPESTAILHIVSTEASKPLKRIRRVRLAEASEISSSEGATLIVPAPQELAVWSSKGHLSEFTAAPFSTVRFAEDEDNAFRESHFANTLPKMSIAAGEYVLLDDMLLRIAAVEGRVDDVEAWQIIKGKLEKYDLRKLDLEERLNLLQQLDRAFPSLRETDLGTGLEELRARLASRADGTIAIEPARIAVGRLDAGVTLTIRVTDADLLGQDRLSVWVTVLDSGIAVDRQTVLLQRQAGDRDGIFSGQIAVEKASTHTPAAGVFGVEDGYRIEVQYEDRLQTRSEIVVIEKDAGTPVLEERDETQPQQSALEQNYPNPFNSGTVIRFDLQRPAPVRLEVYDLAGQRVAILINGSRGRGAHTVRWDGRGERGQSLASGVYLYRLRAGIWQQTRRMLLLR